MTCAAFSIKFAKTNQKFAENFEFCEQNSLLLVNYSLPSLEGIGSDGGGAARATINVHVRERVKTSAQQTR